MPVSHESNGDQYVISDSHLGSRRATRVIVIGFGAAGINLAYVLGRSRPHNNVTVQCYDKNPEVGGTWYENR
jgi:cation diffusion facilitator CzcD-associated flavoprotein CzcO